MAVTNTPGQRQARPSIEWFRTDSTCSYSATPPWNTVSPKTHFQREPLIAFWSLCWTSRGWFGNVTVYAILRYLGEKVNSKWSWEIDRKWNPASLKDEWSREVYPCRTIPAKPIVLYTAKPMWRIPLLSMEDGFLKCISPAWSYWLLSILCQLSWKRSSTYAASRLRGCD